MARCCFVTDLVACADQPPVWMGVVRRHIFSAKTRAELRPRQRRRWTNLAKTRDGRFVGPDGGLAFFSEKFIPRDFSLPLSPQILSSVLFEACELGRSEISKTQRRALYDMDGCLVRQEKIAVARVEVCTAEFNYLKTGANWNRNSDLIGAGWKYSACALEQKSQRCFLLRDGVNTWLRH